MKKKMIAYTRCQAENNLNKIQGFLEPQKMDNVPKDKTKNMNMLEEKFTYSTRENLAKKFTWDEPIGKEIW